MNHHPGTPGGHLTPTVPGSAGAPGARPLRMGVVGLLAGALLGGGAGAGVAVVVTSDGDAGSPGVSSGQVVETSEPATDVAAASAAASPSVVTVYVTGRGGSGSGSGVVLTEDGFVVTNNHVVAADGSGGVVQVRTADGTLHDAVVVGTQPSLDLAVLRVEGAGSLTPATFADSEDVVVGDLAVAIGAPLGLSQTVTDGIISATHRAVSPGGDEGGGAVIDALQTDAAINPGNSGGALVDRTGAVIGINTAIASVPAGPGQAGSGGNIGVGFAIPSNTAHRIAMELVHDGSASTAVLGVRATTVSDGRVATGAELVEVRPGSPAAADLRPGDVVTAVGDRPVTTSKDLTAAVRRAAPGDTVALTLLRGGETSEHEVVLGRADV
ncbi:S1C family serine protease [Blastococcus litoris]|uniref:S1C family serine protease n=1 Tax=Blastococcus litoris TaxID=2171622 RepID=UPI001F137D8D|nr:trypsin-like peptidase domain-containing protein [Blastococcus litoris]